MTAELYRTPIRLGRRQIVFASVVEPLKLLDPTSAARLVGLQRHTLACYRSLGEGPAYYKMGRWIRYRAADLERWAGHPVLSGRLELGSETTELPSFYLIDTAAAARFLTLTRFCLLEHRKAATGPRYQRLGRRVFYATGDLLSWAESTRIMPR